MSGSGLSKRPSGLSPTSRSLSTCSGGRLRARVGAQSSSTRVRGRVWARLGVEVVRASCSTFSRADSASRRSTPRVAARFTTGLARRAPRAFDAGGAARRVRDATSRASSEPSMPAGNPLAGSRSADATSTSDRARASARGHCLRRARARRQSIAAPARPRSRSRRPRPARRFGSVERSPRSRARARERSRRRAVREE